MLIENQKRTEYMAQIVILGAGLTGLSTAYHLEKNNFFDFKLFERETTHGGLCRSVDHDGFTFDFSGHLLHCNNNYFETVLATVLPEKERNTIQRKSFIFSNNHLVPYPFQMNLHGLPTHVIAECLCGFAKRKHQIKPQNFYEWVIKYFGKGIAKHFFFPYHHKLLQYNLKKIHPSWTGRFVPKTTIKDLLEGIAQPTNKSVGYNHVFHYPKKNGIQQFTNNLRNQIFSHINTEHNATTIDLKEKVVVFENGQIEPFETLITTIPLSTLLKQLKQPSSLNIQTMYQKLHCNAVVNFNLGFHKTQQNDNHWIYLPEKKYQPYRIGFWHTFSTNMVKKNCEALYGELAYLPKRTNKKTINELTKKSIQQTCDLLKISAKQIVTQKNLHIPHAYVIYNQWRENNLQALHKRLSDHAVHSIGRYGEWKYSSMQEAILDGQKIVAELLQQKSKFIPAKEYVDPQNKIIPKHRIQKEKTKKQNQLQGE